MHVFRYSAVEIFGIAIDSPKQLHPMRALDLMNGYSVDPVEVPVETRDITPYYFRNNKFRYFLSRERPDGPAAVELMPVHHDSEYVSTTVIGDTLIFEREPVRTLEIPTQLPGFMLVGSSPRFAGQACLHELIVGIP
jgi:hypothetical protein